MFLNPTRHVYSIFDLLCCRVAQCQCTVCACSFQAGGVFQQTWLSSTFISEILESEFIIWLTVSLISSVFTHTQSLVYDVCTWHHFTFCHISCFNLLHQRDSITEGSWKALHISQRVRWLLTHTHVIYVYVIQCKQCCWTVMCCFWQLLSVEWVLLHLNIFTMMESIVFLSPHELTHVVNFISWRCFLFFTVLVSESLYQFLSVISSVLEWKLKSGECVF